MMPVVGIFITNITPSQTALAVIITPVGVFRNAPIPLKMFLIILP
jgi:hypothetical protein